LARARGGGRDGFILSMTGRPLPHRDRWEAPANLDVSHSIPLFGGIGCAASIRSCKPPQRMFTAREMISPMVTIETIDCSPITIFAMWVRGIVSVGEKAAAFVSDTYR